MSKNQHGSRKITLKIVENYKNQTKFSRLKVWNRIIFTTVKKSLWNAKKHLKTQIASKIAICFLVKVRNRIIFIKVKKNPPWNLKFFKMLNIHKHNREKFKKSLNEFRINFFWELIEVSISDWNHIYLFNVRKIGVNVENKKKKIYLNFVYQITFKIKFKKNLKSHFEPPNFVGLCAQF